MPLLVLLVAVAAWSSEVRVTVRAGERGEVACAVRDSDGEAVPERLVPVGPGHWLWPQSSGDVLSCSSPGFEPVDVEAGPGVPPRDVSLELLPARPVTLRGDWRPIHATVEWRRLESGATTPLARQSLPVRGPVTVPVASEPRVLRLYAPGASPVSVFVPAGTSAVTLELPKPRPGGELFGFLPAQVFVPGALELSAGAVLESLTPGPERVFHRSGLPAGIYSLVPTYRGGLRGMPQAVIVRTGETSELLPLALPNTGAVGLVAGPEVCNRDRLPAQLLVRRITEENTVEPQPLYTESIQQLPCDRELEGLDDGWYEVLLARVVGTPEVVSSARFPVRAGVRAEVVLPSPAVRVSGRVTFGETRPASGLLLRFEFNQRTWTAHTDGGGEYSVEVGEPGDYTVSIGSASDLPSVVDTRRLREGDQRQDFGLSEGAVHVRVIRDDGLPVDETVQLALTSSSGRRISGSSDPGRDGTARFVGIDFGDWWVTARTPSGLSSQNLARVELMPEAPVADAELVLGQYMGLLRAVDELGAPLRNASVAAGDTMLSEVGAGVFALESVPIGEKLVLRGAGHLPVCRFLQQHDLPEMTVALPRATDTVTLVAPAQIPWETGSFRDLPGSECPIAVGDLETAVDSTENATRVVVRLATGRFRFVIGSATYSVAVPGSEVRLREQP